MDIATTFSLLFRGVNAVWDWFVMFFTNIGIEWYHFVCGIVFAVAFWRLILFPLFGGHFSVGSDYVKRIDEKDRDLFS